jgi:perosamine synthetase
MKVRLFKPSVGKEELAAIKEVFDRAWLGLGPKVGEFETEWSKYIGCNSSIAVNSGTAALHLALAAFRFPPGARVLVPAITFISTAVAALYNQLEPIFVDVNEETLGLDLNDLERKVTKDCVAIMAVHMGGHPLPMDEIVDFAQSHRLKVIEDCAHCAGGEFQGKKLGTFGDIGCFSFEEKKSMTTGDGGMICAKDADLIEPLRAMRWVGIDKDTWKRNAAYTFQDTDSHHWYYEISELGYKYNMNDLSAAIGLVQLKKLDQMNATKREAIRYYLERLKKAKHISPLLPYDHKSNSAYWMFGVKSEKRDELILHLKKKEIATSVHYTPLPLQPLFKNHRERIPIARKVYDQMVTLPLFADITKAEIDYVADAILDFDQMISN